MKRLLLTAVTALTFVGPLGATAAEAKPGDRHGQWNDNGRHGHDWRRGDSRWDHRRNNGYWYQNRWHYGPPPAYYYGRPGFNIGYREWRRGEYLPSYYRQRYAVVDWRYHHLRPPPRGYHYVRDDRGDVILAAIATGLIASVILSH